MKDSGVSQKDIDDYFSSATVSPFAGKKPLTIYIIRPDAPLGGGPGGLEFNPVEMRGMLAKGADKASEFIASLPKPLGPVA